MKGASTFFALMGIAIFQTGVFFGVDQKNVINFDELFLQTPMSQVLALAAQVEHQLTVQKEITPEDFFCLKRHIDELQNLLTIFFTAQFTAQAVEKNNNDAAYLMQRVVCVEQLYQERVREQILIRLSTLLQCHHS